MSQLRVCIVASYDLAEEGGVKKHAVHLAAQLRELGDHVDIIGPYSGQERPQRGPGGGLYGFRGVVNIPANGSDNRMGVFACPWLVWKFFKDGQYDVVHIMEPSVPSLCWYAGWFARAGNPRAVRIATFHAFSEQEGALFRFTRSTLCALQMKLFDRGIAVSPAAARFAEAGWNKPLAIIPNGIDTGLFSLGETPAPGRPVRLLFVGHYHDPRKGLPTLVDAYTRLRRAGSPITLDVVGNGDPHDRPVSDALGITYHGAIADETKLAEIYRGCDIFVAPSTGMESFGIVLLEAMASGRPIICSDIEGYRHVVANSAARLTPPGNAIALEAAIDDLVRDPASRRQMGEANRRAALAFDWRALASRIRGEYLAALSMPLESVPAVGIGSGHQTTSLTSHGAPQR
jgi:phosphatidyl-myo-inositol alpha-mannosyltransferase